MVKIQTLEDRHYMVTLMPQNKSGQTTSSSANLSDDDNASKTLKETTELAKETKSKPVEVGGRGGPDPVRYGDWEKGGRCIDF